jgi:hypothetical protein
MTVARQTLKISYLLHRPQTTDTSLTNESIVVTNLHTLLLTSPSSLSYSAIGSFPCIPLRIASSNFFLVSWGGVRVVPLGARSLIGLLHQPRMIDDDDECGMRIGRGNGNTRRKPAPGPLCPLQIPHELTWARTQASEVGSR